MPVIIWSPLPLKPELSYYRIPHEDIVVATNDFAEENLIKRSGRIDVYKGVLLWSKVRIDVAIHKYRDQDHDNKDLARTIDRFLDHFKSEHRNIVSLIGYCDEKDERMVVMEHVVNGSLDRYLSDPITLTWSQRLNISLGVANAFDFFYSTVRGFKIMLDKDWEAKVRFYIEQDIKYNSDMHNLGVILLEMLYGRKATSEDVNQYLAKMKKTHYIIKRKKKEGGQLDDMIDPILRKQMHPQSLSIFSKIAYYCLKEQPKKKYPDIYHVAKTLEEALEIQWKHEKQRPYINQLLMEKLNLKIPLGEVKLATHNFHYSYKFVADYDVYKAELNCFDMESALAIEGENKGEPSNKTVIIKRMRYISRESLFAKIELHTSYKHRNLFSFLGFCDEDSEKLLIFEYDDKQKLYDILESKRLRNLINWEQRIRICIGIAHEMKYLHSMEGKASMIDQAIVKSENVFLDKKLAPKITNFYGPHLKATDLWQSRAENFRTWLVGKRLVVDDIYSLGVILYEILTGRSASEQFYKDYNMDDLNKCAQELREGKLRHEVDPIIMKDAQYSLDAIFEITYQCLARETPSERPTFDVVIKSLEKVLRIQYDLLQVQKLRHLKIPLNDIKSATKNFHINGRIGSGGYGEVYKAELIIKSKDELPDIHIPNSVAIKRIRSREDDQGVEGFLQELDVVSKCKHPNVITLHGSCVEDGELLLVYELASNGSLDDYLLSVDKKSDFKWAQRLKMCIGIAKGLKYMHTTEEGKKKIIHRDIKSANILLGENWEAKLADFGFSKVHHGDQWVSTINATTIAGTEVYLDPEYARTGRLKKASDIYSMGVVLFEIYSGKLAYDSNYLRKNEKGLAPVARKHFKKGTLNDLLDPDMLDEAYELGFTGKVEPNHDSLDVFSRIAYQCVAKTQVERPTIEFVVEELEKALHFQENRIKTLKIPREDISLGVEDVSGANGITRRGYGMLYKGKVRYNNKNKKVFVKRFSQDRCMNNTSLSWEHGFLKEFEVLFKYKQENIIGLVGYCEDMDEKIIVYEHASKGSLDRYLNDTSFSWTERLKICIGITNGLKFLHDGGDLGQDVVIHRDIRSSNVLLTEDWKAKICGFEHALTYPTNQKIKHIVDNVEGSLGYSDPSFLVTHFLTKESDIYSLGVILFEILCGRLACPEDSSDHTQFLSVMVKRHSQEFQEARLEEIVFEGIKEKIGQNSLATFGKIAFQCLLDERNERPSAGDVVAQLQNALEFQEAYETRKAKLYSRKDKEILQFSKSREIYSARAKKDIYEILSKGILLEDDKLEIIRALQHTTLDLEQEDDD